MTACFFLELELFSRLRFGSFFMERISLSSAESNFGLGVTFSPLSVPF